eukprot:PhF_6_TR8739/c0_g3_i1/m.13749
MGAYIRKFGPSAQQWLTDPNNPLLVRARSVGLTMDYVPGSKTGNTFNAHRLLLLAETKSLKMQNDLQEVLFRKYFTEGHSVGETNVLLDAVAEVNMMSKEEATEFLSSQQLVDEVKQLLQIPARTGVNGVPYFKFPGN